ncbi:glycerophosphodiester phosphodiesterase family protein [Corynebacterium halotolerans]|uniref:Glycerophosphoryl diester phosphodiesterase n=1 Tax=Corynebacterium halotolerans YIM 70093 = DSM 44683 TaxID=1121362 RepID=M1PAD9_9CORY|nr:glycerophosphodiester phosphodiesterase family protein [Corynebacterium halotolerans]AGF73646.1 glycerophosphoryl diester phosphodiesterase [Corynebacterium halotolerans YIM 70093 = DSM 44683]
MEIIAHRGYSGRYPELTRVAFEKALELPVHGIECDVRLTRDGKLVVVHDAEIGRVSDGRGKVAQLTLAQLREFNFGTESSPQSVLTLDELLELFADHPEHHLYIETKHPVPHGRIVEEQVLMRLRYAGLYDDPRIHVISFSQPAIVRLRALAPHLDRIRLRRRVERRLNPVDLHLGRPTGLGLSLERARANPGLIGRHGLPTYLWTVNEPEDLRWARDHGVDLVATDEPGTALEVLGR